MDYLKNKFTFSPISFSQNKEKPSNKPLKYVRMLTGKTLDSDNAVMDRLKKTIRDLQEVDTEAECDIILVFCPVVRGPATDIKAAMEKLSQIPDTKPAVLVVLHHTFDPACVTSDSSKDINRDNTIMVNCLFHEDQGLLKCQKNDESLRRIIDYIDLQIGIKKSLEEPMETEQSGPFSMDKHKQEREKRKHTAVVAYGPPVTSRHQRPGEQMKSGTAQNFKQSNVDAGPKQKKAPVKYFTLLAGQTLKTHMDFITQLKNEIPELLEVYQVEKSDFILAFCPVVSRAGTDIDAALKKLNLFPAARPVVLVVLHRTFDPECVVPDSSRAVNREKTITVDCLFYEDQGLLHCKKNKDSLTRIINYIKHQIQPVFPIKDNIPMSSTKNTHACFWMERNPNCLKALLDHLNQMPGLKVEKTDDEWGFLLTFYPALKHSRDHEKQEEATLKYFPLPIEQTPNAHEILNVQLKDQIPQLQEVHQVDKCDFILTFCPVVSQAGADIDAALKKLHNLSAAKPAVLVVLHHTADPEYVVPDSSRAVHRENTITVDCLFYKDQGLLDCKKNKESCTRIIKYIKPQIQSELSKMDTMETEQTHMLSTGPPQCSDKQENTSKEADPSRNQLKAMEMKLEMMTTKVANLETELAEKNKQLAKNENLFNTMERQLAERQTASEINNSGRNKV